MKVTADILGLQRSAHFKVRGQVLVARVQQEAVDPPRRLRAGGRRQR